MTQLTEQYIDGRKDKSQDQPHGPTQSDMISQKKDFLVPTQGRESRQDGGVAEKSNSPISGPAKDAPSKYTQFPIKLLVKQNHQGIGVQQVRSLQSSMDSRREIQHGRRAPYPDPRPHTTPMRSPLGITYTRTPSVLAYHSLRIGPSRIH
jgi:hypothetical protein